MNTIDRYFQGEKWQCTLGIIFSVLCIALSIYFLYVQKPILKGIAFSVIPLSALLLMVCIGVVIKTPGDVARVNSFYQCGTQVVKAEELPRMEKVMKTFSLLKTIELCLFVTGIVFCLLFWRNELVRGIFIGIAIQCAFLYIFDYTAALRGNAYLDFLRTL